MTSLQICTSNSRACAKWHMRVYWKVTSCFFLQYTFPLDLLTLAWCRRSLDCILRVEQPPPNTSFTWHCMQQYLAAVHISQLSAHKQSSLVQEHLDNSHFKMTMRFWAGLTKVASDTDKDDGEWQHQTDLFYLLFEAKDILVTTRTLGSNEICVRPHYFWTPLDYYVIGHAISHSNCPCVLNYWYSSIDDEKFELLCQGCSTPGMQWPHYICQFWRQCHYLQKHSHF